jgi:hypothetical protein
VFTFTNNCPQSVWVASQGNPLPEGGGWKMVSGASKTINVPNSLSAARFWVRTACTLNPQGRLTCASGHCPLPEGMYNGTDGTMCGGIGALPPNTLVELTLGGNSGDDFYDLSLVDGFNIPISMSAVGGTKSRSLPVDSKYNCGSPSCPRFNMQRCPPELRLLGSNGEPIACLSICAAVHSEQHRSQHPILQSIWTGKSNGTGYSLANLVCCACGENNTGCYDPRSEFCCSPIDPMSKGGKCFVEQWPLASDGQRYDQVFKHQCEDAYSWQFDDMQSTYQCVGANYNIAFCP